MMALSPPFLAFSPILFCIFLLAAVSCLTIHYLIYSKRITQWSNSKIPFLRPTFLIGHKYFLSVTKSSFLVPLDRIYRENPDKDAVGLFMGTIPLILIRNPRLAHQVFAKHSDKTLTGWIGAEDDEIAQNMIRTSIDKGVWKNGRDTLGSFFYTSRMSGVQFDQIRRQMDKLWIHAEEAQLNGRPVNATAVALNFVMDGMSLAYFGQDTNGYKEKGELHRLVEDFFEPSVSRMLSFYAQMQFPGARYMLEFFKLVSKKQTNAMTALLDHSINDKIQHETKANDFVDFLIAYRDAFNDGLNMKQMVGLSLDVMLWGGSDSVAILASFAIHLLSLHPEYQNRIREEMADGMRKHKTTELTFDVVQDLHFTHQCILETARLYPSLPAIIRLCTDDFQVPGTEYIFKKGDRVIIDPYSVHRDPKYFKSPEAFDPDRFSPEKKKNIAPESFLSFGNGPRRCPGYRIGALMGTTLISALLLKYKINPRSHVKQMNATDFHPRCFANIQRENVLIDLVPHKIVVQ